MDETIRRVVAECFRTDKRRRYDEVIDCMVLELDLSPAEATTIVAMLLVDNRLQLGTGTGQAGQAENGLYPGAADWLATGPGFAALMDNPSSR